MAFNDEMERYMRDRKRRSMTYTGDGASQPGWWDRVFFPKKEDAPRDHLTPDEMAKVTAMEQDIKKGEERLEDADDTTHETLADKQEARVGLYERFLRMFQTERKMEDDYEHIDGEQLHGTTVIKNDPDVTEDFKTLALIQVKWFERMPTRVKEEFKESEDYLRYKDILQRRGVAKK